MNRAIRRGVCVLAVSAAAGLAVVPAYAQAPGGPTPAKKEKEYKPPTPVPPTNPPSQPAQMVIAVGILAMLLGASLIPSKRGHQD